VLLLVRGDTNIIILRSPAEGRQEAKVVWHLSEARVIRTSRGWKSYGLTIQGSVALTTNRCCAHYFAGAQLAPVAGGSARCARHTEAISVTSRHTLRKPVNHLLEHTALTDTQTACLSPWAKVLWQYTLEMREKQPESSIGGCRESLLHGNTEPFWDFARRERVLVFWIPEPVVAKQ
jgi:hypothetical protein